MVRLRTDRWYSADGQGRSRSRVAQQTGGSRRLLSLFFLLALVVLLMQKAADPRHVRNAFQALGVPLHEAPPGELPLEAGLPAATAGQSAAPLKSAAPLNSTLSEGPSQTGPATAPRWETTCRDLLPRLLDGLTDNELIELAKSWFAPTPPAVTEGPLPLVMGEGSLSILDTLSENTRQAAISETAQQAWLQQLEEFRAQWQQLGDQPNRNHLPSAVSPTLQAALTHYLDQRLVSLLHDATPWTSAETVPFWRFLQRGKERGGEADMADAPTATHSASSSHGRVPTVNTLQLAAAADSLRGTSVHFRGSVRRVEHIQRSYPPLGMQGGYWILWLRGQDAAVQPVAVYTTDQRAAQLAQQLKPESPDFPEIEVQAISAKRLAYASQSGVQVAPTLFASRLTLLSSPPPAVAPVTPTKLWNQFLVAVLGACLLAATILIPIVWQRSSGATGNRRLLGPRTKSRQAAVGDSQQKSGHIAAAAVTCFATLSLTTSMFVSAAAQPVQGAPPTPPWASGDQVDPLQNLFRNNMQSLFDKENLTELREYQTNRGGSFPDSLLKVFHATRRVTWRRALALSDPLAFDDQTQLRSRTLSGWVRLATPVVLDQSQQSWFQALDEEQLYRVELQLQNDLFDNSAVAQTVAAQTADSPLDRAQLPQLVTVYCRQVPRAWLTSARLRQPAQFTALTFDDAARSEIPWCAVAAGPVWRLPPTMDSSQLRTLLAPPLAEQYLALGLLGWDLANIETVADHQQQPLSSDEAAGFYSLIRMVGAARFSTTAEANSRDPPLKTLARAEQSLGKEISWPIRIVSGTLVAVDNLQHRQQLGAEAYIQLDGFVDIGSNRIRFQPATADNQPGTALDFEGEFPITIVSAIDTSLIPPQTMATGERSWDIGQYATLHGRFYRLWSYQSEAVKSSGQSARQIAPLVIAERIVPTPPPIRGHASEVGWFGWALCGSTLVILAGVLWSAAGSLKKRKRLSH